MRKRTQLWIVLNFLFVHMATIMTSVGNQSAPIAPLLIASVQCGIQHSRQRSLDFGDSRSTGGESDADSTQSSKESTPVPFLEESSVCFKRQVSECETRYSDCATRYSDNGLSAASSRESLTAFYDKDGCPRSGSCQTSPLKGERNMSESWLTIGSPRK